MIKKYLPLTLALLCFYVLRAQEEELSVAPQVNPFSLKGDNLGAIANAVNLFTGDVNLPLSLVSIPGSGGIGINVSVSYSSANIENTVDLWNLEAPTGVLGLGWSLSYPQIVVNNKQTAARDDDEFYLIQNGVSTPLICEGESNGIKNYRTEKYTNWVITYEPAVEKWGIRDEHGIMHIYGGAPERGTIQWVATWNNWIGDSKQPGASFQGLVWNLSEIINLWGEKIQFTYQNVGQPYPGSQLQQTEASYLSKITDSWGHEVVLLYQEKLPEEYMEPHTEMAEPDAYQERYEKKFLDKIIIHKDDLLQSEIQFWYRTNLLGSGNLTKRLLTSIEQFTPGAAVVPPFTFDYLTAGDMKGALSKVTTAFGGSVNFSYEEGILSQFSREIDISPEDDSYAEPRVFLGDDYVVVTWRQLQDGNHTASGRRLKIFVYTWDGKWVKSSFENVFGVTLKHKFQDFQLQTGKDFFALLKPNSSQQDIYLWHKDPGQIGKWKVSQQVMGGNTGKEKLLMGDQFVAVTNEENKIVALTWNGDVWSRTDINIPSDKIYSTAANNYIACFDRGVSPDKIRFYYLDEQKNWVLGNDYTLSTNSTQDWIWEGTASFITGGNDDDTFAFWWNSNYSQFFWKKLCDFRGIYSRRTVPIGDGVGVYDLQNEQLGMFRFNGSGWVDNLKSQVDYPSFGYDRLIYHHWNEPLTRIDQFNPNTGQWSLLQNFASAVIAPRNYTGVDYCIIEQNLFFQQSNGIFQGSFDLSEVLANHGVHYFPFQRHCISIRFDSGSPEPFNTRVFYLKNGTVSGQYSFTKRRSDASVDFLGHDVISESNLVSNHTMVTVAQSSWPGTPFQDVTSLRIHRYFKDRFEGALSDFPVTHVSFSDGVKTNYTTYEYTFTTAKFDPSGTVLQYNKVKTIPGSPSAASTPQGYTETYFFNGLSANELGEPFPQGVLPQYLSLFTGNVYRSQAFNASGSLVSKEETIWTAFSFDILNAVSYRSYGVTVPTKKLIYKNGIDMKIFYGYNNKFQLSGEGHEFIDPTQNLWKGYVYGWEAYSDMKGRNMLSPMIQETKSSATQTLESHVTRWEAWPCHGPNCRWNEVPQPKDQFEWTGDASASSNFTWWGSATPSSNWTFSSAITLRDDQTGIALENQIRGNQYASIFLNKDKTQVTASISNARRLDVAYNSFEDTDKGNWSWNDGTIQTGPSQTGEKYFSLGTTGLTKTSLTPSTTYKLSLWVKTNGGSINISGESLQSPGNLTEWTYQEYILSNRSSITISKSGSAEVQLDEVRLHPLDADMVTTTYDSKGRKTAETNVNNISTYYEYDELDRPTLIRDDRRDIRKQFKYNHQLR